MSPFINSLKKNKLQNFNFNKNVYKIILFCILIVIFYFLYNIFFNDYIIEMFDINYKAQYMTNSEMSSLLINKKFKFKDVTGRDPLVNNVRNILTTITNDKYATFVTSNVEQTEYELRLYDNDTNNIIDLKHYCVGTSVYNDGVNVNINPINIPVVKIIPTQENKYKIYVDNDVQYYKFNIKFYVNNQLKNRRGDTRMKCKGPYNDEQMFSDYYGSGKTSDLYLIMSKVKE